MALSFQSLAAVTQNATTTVRHLCTLRNSINGSPWSQYFSAPAFSNLAFNISTPYSDLTSELSDNAYFLTCFRGPAVPVQAPAIYDSQGGLVWMSPDLGASVNLDQQTYNGQSVLTVWVGSIESVGYGFGNVSCNTLPRKK